MKSYSQPVDLKTEIIAGLTTFLAMSYIIFVNPQILSVTGMDKNSLIAATCIASAVGTLLIGIFAHSPIAMAPGMGLNAFFAYFLVVGEKIPWATALGIVFLSGVLFLVLTLAGIRAKLVDAIPKSLIFAISVGIGLFITFIGLVNLGLVVKNDATLVGMGKFTPTVLIGLLGLLIMVGLELKKIKGSLLIGIFASTIIALIAGKIPFPQQILTVNINLAPIAFKLDILGALKWSFFGAIFSLMFMDLFDSLGTLVACSHKAKLSDQKNYTKIINRLLGLDALATMIGAVLGTSTTTAYIESGAGIEAGGRTGVTAAVTGILFLLGLFFVPLIGIVPNYATAPALIMVGLFMTKEIVKINFDLIEEAFPAFIIIIMIALSYSISSGLALGFISFTLLKALSGKSKEIKPAMWAITILSVLFFII
ncbi:MAG: guanine permease [Desulfobacca sp.]|nr:guanine permease [Desulfobacca sp.]